MVLPSVWLAKWCYNNSSFWLTSLSTIILQCTYWKKILHITKHRHLPSTIYNGIFLSSNSKSVSYIHISSSSILKNITFHRQYLFTLVCVFSMYQWYYDVWFEMHFRQFATFTLVKPNYLHLRYLRGDRSPRFGAAPVPTPLAVDRRICATPFAIIL